MRKYFFTLIGFCLVVTAQAQWIPVPGPDQAAPNVLAVSDEAFYAGMVLSQDGTYHYAATACGGSWKRLLAEKRE